MTIGQAPAAQGLDLAELAALDVGGAGDPEPARDHHPVMTREDSEECHGDTDRRPSARSASGGPAAPSWADPRPAWARSPWASLLDPEACSRAAEPEPPGAGRKWRGVVKPLHFAPKAKRVIHLYMAGGPSHLEIFDYKPKLAEMHGQPMPESFTKGQPIAQLQNQKLKLLRPAAPVQQVRQVGPGDLDALPAHRRRSPTRSASSAR